MPAEARQASHRLRQLAAASLVELWLAAFWLLYAWLDYAVACHRWSGWRFDLNLWFSGFFALTGWRLVRRAASRYDDARLGNLLAQVEDAPDWALFPHPVQIIKREHLSRCLRRWGVTPRTSGWERFCRSWTADAALAVGCLGLTVHSWWMPA